MPHSSLTRAYDLVVIGGGNAGMQLARLSAQCGQRVALVESQELGGACVSTGCLTQRLYRFAADYAHALEEEGGYGWRMDSSPWLDFAHLKQQHQQELQRTREGYAQSLMQAGVQCIKGVGYLLDANTVQVGADVRLKTKYVAIATGSHARVPEIAGRHLALLPEEAWTLPRLPQHLVIVGGGQLGCEMASIFHALGSKVTLVQRNTQLLSRWDVDLGQALQGRFQAQGMDVLLESDVIALEAASESEGSERRVHLQDGRVLKADAVLYAIGRTPSTSYLGLDALGIACDRQGRVLVDACLRTSVRNVFALGDVISEQRVLMPVALAQATTVAAQLTGRAGYVAQDSLVPRAVFTHPELASVGYTEQSAQQEGRAVKVYVRCFTPLRQRLSGQMLQQSLLKLLVDARTDQVIGMHMLGDGASEMLQGYSLAMQSGLTKSVLDASWGIHPSTAQEWVGMTQQAPWSEGKKESVNQ